MRDDKKSKIILNNFARMKKKIVFYCLFTIIISPPLYFDAFIIVFSSLLFIKWKYSYSNFYATIFFIYSIMLHNIFVCPFQTIYLYVCSPNADHLTNILYPKSYLTDYLESILMVIACFIFNKYF